MYMKNLRVYGADYYDFISLISSGEVYYILISKRLLIKPMMSIWAYLLVLFLVRSNIFFAMVGLPSLIVFSVFLVIFFPLWEACNVSAKAYIVFHGASILLIKIISIPVSMLLGVLWTLCF